MSSSSQVSCRVSFQTKGGTKKGGTDDGGETYCPARQYIKAEQQLAIAVAKVFQRA